MPWYCRQRPPGMAAADFPRSVPAPTGRPGRTRWLACVTYGVQGWLTTQLTSFVQEVPLSNVFEPPLLAMYTVLS